MPILILLAFIAVPIAEIAVLIEVGEIIGTWETIALVIGTAVFGTFLIRAQGAGILNRARANLANDQPPVGELFEGICLLFAGAFLLTPGFLTDSLGFLILIPSLRRGIGNAIWRFLQKRSTVRSWAYTGGPSQARPGHPNAGCNTTVIEGDFTEINPKSSDQRPDSPWSEKP